MAEQKETYKECLARAQKYWEENDYDDSGRNAIIQTDCEEAKMREEQGLTEREKCLRKCEQLGGRRRSKRKTRRKTRRGGKRRLYRVKAVKAWLKRTKRRRKKRKTKKKKKRRRRRRTRR